MIDNQNKENNISVSTTTSSIPQSTAIIPENHSSKESTPSASQTSQEGKKKIEGKTQKQNQQPTLIILFLIIIAILLFFISYIYSSHQQEIVKLKDSCTPVSTSGEIKELDLNSTIVKDLYSKVKTNIREDIANPELNDQMKLYLAYRQMPTNKIYESNCNLYMDTKMEPYTCKETLEFTPTAFKEEDLIIEFKKLFGENENFKHRNIQLGTSCLGGYQYIAERGEYVEGECPSITSVVFKADKKLIKATSQESTIILYEDVKYIATSGQAVPEKLKDGTYKYTFKLDTNYNYIYINKELEI